MNSSIIAPPLAGNIIGSIENDFVIAEWRDAGGPTGPPRYIAPPHVHHRDDEAWYVLEGVLRVQVGKDVVEAAASASDSCRAELRPPIGIPVPAQRAICW